MKISHTWLQTFFDSPIPTAEKLADLFTFHSFEVEGVENVEAGEIGDTILDVKILPDRAHYCLSHKGIAEEVSVLTGAPLKVRKDDMSGARTLDAQTEVSIVDERFCRRYMCRLVDLGRPASSSPARISTFLQAIGQRHISPIVDATNAVMFDLGQPLHAFDADKVRGALVVRPAHDGETIELLEAGDGKIRIATLTPNDYVIADDTGALAIAGVKGGRRAHVTDKTTRLLIESANFDPIAIRRTSNRLNLRNESSKRFENEITPELAEEGIKSISALIFEMNPKAYFGSIVDVYPKKETKRIVVIDPAYISTRLGAVIPEATIRDILTKMGVDITENSAHGLEQKKLWSLALPFGRYDLAIAEDVVEEVGRIYGYDRIPGVVPDFGYTKGSKVPVQPEFYLTEKIKNILVAHGFSEVNLYTLVAHGDVETAYPLARDKAFARASLIEGMAACVERNTVNAELLGLDTILIFEVGRVFSGSTKSGTPRETSRLVLGVSQIKKIKGSSSDQRITAEVQALGSALGVKIAPPKIISKGPLSGAGSVSVCEIDITDMLASSPVAQGVSYAELSFGPAAKNTYKKFSLYPFMVRDIALFVQEAVSSDEVWREIAAGISAAKASELLVRHNLFDTFKKEGKVSYAFRMIFQSMERTLTDAELATVMDAVYAAVKSKGWEVR